MTFIPYTRSPSPVEIPPPVSDFVAPPLRTTSAVSAAMRFGLAATLLWLLTRTNTEEIFATLPGWFVVAFAFLAVPVALLLLSVGLRRWFGWMGRHNIAVSQRRLWLLPLVGPFLTLPAFPGRHRRWVLLWAVGFVATQLLLVGFFAGESEALRWIGLPLLVAWSGLKLGSRRV